jgi:hypothetical protein
MICRSPKTTKPAFAGSSCRRPADSRGFALVVTLMLMIFLTVVAVGMLSLSAISLRSNSHRDALSEARANSRLALMIAIGELQKEMGPDMRVSAKSVIFDQDPATEAIEGVEYPHWLASYESWGNWLNASYQNPASGETLNTIRDTYTPKREKMFRRWLLSLPAGMEDDIDAPVNPGVWNDSNSVVLIGEGSAGSDAGEIRAYLSKVGQTGRNAWWIGPENHKVRIDKAKNPRTLTAGQWETAQGDTAEVGIGVLQGLGMLDANAAISDRLVTAPTLVPAGIDEAIVKSHFFDLTESSCGVLASVRTGHLKKDLSLLFESPKETLPDLYRFDVTTASPPVPIDVREPSIRPMSPEIANRAVLKERHFAPWTRMRHFYRMYRQDSDAQARTWAAGGTNGSPGMRWDGTKPWTGCNINWDSASATSWPWPGEETYVRFPILASVTYILSLKTDLANATPPARYNVRVVASPVVVYWNPYNVELRVPDKHMVFRSYLEMVHPIDRRFFLGDTLQNEGMALGFDDDAAMVRSGKPPNTTVLLPDMIFKPGQFRIFAPDAATLVAANQMDIIPGFDPQAFGGLFRNFGTYTLAQNPKTQLRFSHKATRNNNFIYGNTPASLSLTEWWADQGNFFAPSVRKFVPFAHHVDWTNTSQLFSFLSSPAAPDPWFLPGQNPPDNKLIPVAYFQLALKGIHDHDYPSINWERDWRCRNWLQSPPFYHGKGLFMSEDPVIGHTQRIDSPFELRFGPLLGAGKDVDDIIQHIGQSAIMGLGERVTAVSSLELPTAPIGSLGGFGAMAIDPGWVRIATLNPDWKMGFAPGPPGNNATGHSLYRAPTKASAYQSGVTGPGIGNSFLHPMIPRTDVYQFLDNSISMDMKNTLDANAGYNPINTKAYCDYWDHVLLLNDALWDDYFVSSLADQTRPSEATNVSLDKNLDKLVNREELANSRYLYYTGGKAKDKVKVELKAADGYLKAAAHLMVDGMFNVNSTSVAAWQALFAGIRERQVVYRDTSGALQPVAIPAGKRIALSRFGVETTDKECEDPESGVVRDDGMSAWSGVRFLDDTQIRKLAEECVKQVKRRGPFLNFSEFINRRLSDDELGTMGALQSAIDYDDASPQPGSINYNFKSHSDYMLSASQLGTHSFKAPEAAVGSRFAGIPGYVIQSDLLRPIANTLSVRDDTFRIRAYGDSIDINGKVVARAWCEAIVQRVPEYCDQSNSPEIPARLMSEDGQFSENSALTPVNRRFGRKFQIASFRWLNGSEI